MHYLHAILVKADLEHYERLKDKPEDLAQYFQTIAFEETEKYGDGRAFEWRAEGPGRWSEFYPEVMFGADPQFADTLSEFSKKPLENALEIVEGGFYESLGFRSQERLDQDPSIKVLKECTTHRGKQVFWSGRHVPDVTVTPQLIRDMWERKDVLFTTAVYEAITLAYGDYRASSCFYSVPCGGVKLSEDTLTDVKERPYLYALVFTDYHD